MLRNAMQTYAVPSVAARTLIRLQIEKTNKDQ